jgi:hypothetical protein
MLNVWLQQNKLVHFESNASEHVQLIFLGAYVTHLKYLWKNNRLPVDAVNLQFEGTTSV